MSYVVKLPFPPSTNTLFINLSESRRAVIAAGMKRKGKFGMPPPRAISKGYKEWREIAETHIKLAKLPRFDKPVDITLTLVPGDTRGRDADNYAKAVLDALKRVCVIKDDKSTYVRSVLQRWENPDDHPHVLVEIELADMTGVKLPLDAAERAAMRRIKATGIYLVGPKERPSKAVRGLLEKGYLDREPGLLLDDQPQAYKIKG